MLDWDSAGPGSRAGDVATSAYRWVPLNPRVTRPAVSAKAPRFALFCETYGSGLTRHDVLDALLDRLPRQADFIRSEAAGGDPGYAKLAAWNIPAVLRDDAARLGQQREALCGPR